MAFWASPFEAISTNPKPRERPVSRSVMTDADSQVPTSANSASRSALVVSKDRFPTNSFLPMISLLLPPSPGGMIASQLYEREAEGEKRRRGVAHQQRDWALLCRIGRRRQRPRWGGGCGLRGGPWCAIERPPHASAGCGPVHAVPRSTRTVPDEWPDRYRSPPADAGAAAAMPPGAFSLAPARA